MQNRIIIIYCGLLLTLTAFSIDILLPAFSTIAEDLNASYDDVQLVIPLFLAAVGIGQLFGGSLSDKYGRKFVIQLGLSIYVAGVVICIFATSIETIWVGRVLQGLGTAAGPVVARAIIRDLYSGKELARNLSLATAVFAFGPIIAPLVGVSFLNFFSWRILFVLMLCFAGLLLLFCVFILPETIHTKNPRATRISTFISNIGIVFANPQSRFYLILSGILMVEILLILINIPAIYELNFGISGTLFAVLFAIHGVGIILGQFINRRLLKIISIERTALIGTAFLVTITAIMLVLSLGGWMGPWILTGLLVGHATGYLVVYVNASAMTLEPHGDIAGFTSAFFGFFSQFVSSVIGALLAIFIAGDLIVWAVFLLVVALIVLTALTYRNIESTRM